MNSRRVQRATITDVARLAGVSISTVSRVLNETAPVADDTSQRVQHAVAVLNFHPHAAARTLAVRKTDTVGLLLPEIGSSFFIPTLRGIEAAVREAGFDLLIYTGSAMLGKRELRRPLGEHNTDGLLVFTNQLSSEEVVRFHQREFPIVLMHCSPPRGLPVPHVRFENKQGVRRLIDHLIEVHSRRSIVFLRGPEDNEDSFDREAGYRESLEAHGIALNPALIATANFTEGGAEIVITTLLSKGIAFDAVFGGDDEAAAGVLMALRRADRRVPEEISVVGFDDVPMARHLNPPLTTVRAPIETASYLAARKLVRLIRGSETDVASVLPVELVIRQSCGCA